MKALATLPRRSSTLWHAISPSPFVPRLTTPSRCSAMDSLPFALCTCHTPALHYNTRPISFPQTSGHQNHSHFTPSITYLSVPPQVTPEMLVEGLCEALSGHPALAAYTTPFMTEQLHNPSESAARLQALQCLSRLYSHETTYTCARTSSSCFRDLAEILFELCCSSGTAGGGPGGGAGEGAMILQVKQEASRLVRTICKHLAMRCSKTPTSAAAAADWTHFGEYLLKMCVDGLHARSGNPLDSQVTAQVVHLCAAVGSACSPCKEAVQRALLPLLVPVVAVKLDALDASAPHVSQIPPDDKWSSNLNICCSALSHVVMLLRCEDPDGSSGNATQLQGVTFSSSGLDDDSPRQVFGEATSSLWDILVKRLGSPTPLTTSKLLGRLYRDMLTCVLELAFRY